jgi:nucleoside phosphorylase
VPVVGRDGGEETLDAPQAKNGAIVCGSVSKSKAYNKKLRSIERKILAIETESGGVFAQATAKSIPALTIRGISDHANRDKGELERAE